MRQNSSTFEAFNQSDSKDLRVVIRLDYSTPVFIPSHDDIPNLPAGSIGAVLKNVSSTSQRLMPEQGRAEIGSMSVDVVDFNNVLSAIIEFHQSNDEGLKGLKVELYRGGSGMDWTDFRLEQTQQIDNSVTFKDGVYKISCQDVQRSMKKEIFDLQETALSANYDQLSPTMEVFSTAGFEPMTHVASFGDEQAGSYYYLKIKYNNGFEIVRATGKTATSFTGCVRGLFGTTDLTRLIPEGELNEENSIRVEEYVYIELPAPAMAYALLTGNLIGGGSLPTSWNLGIDTAFVDLVEFQDNHPDWFDPSDYSKGVILRFVGEKKTDGKQFIEKEINMLMGAYLPVKADGRLGLRRMTGVIASSDHTATLDETNVVRYDRLDHKFSKVHNEIDLSWNWLDISGREPKFYRRDILIDADSVLVHGKGRPLKFSFRGLHESRHTRATVRNRFDAIRDRFSGPPLELTMVVLPSMNDLEIGDIVRVNLPQVDDFNTTASLNRAFEIQRISTDQITGKVSLSLFASSRAAGPLADVGTQPELPDAIYDSVGTPANATLTIDGSNFLTADGTLTGGPTSRTVFYHLGDLTIPADKTLTIQHNAALWVMGHLSVLGTIKTTSNLRTAGYLGTTRSGGGHLNRKPTSGGNQVTTDTAGIQIDGKFSTLPSPEIVNSAGVITGVPEDMRGTGGANGSEYKAWNNGGSEIIDDNTGGVGGFGAGSLMIVSRGGSLGVSGLIDLSGTDGAAPNLGVPNGRYYSGGGAGGAPGALVWLIDGFSAIRPFLNGKVDATFGICPILGNLNENGNLKPFRSVRRGKSKAEDQAANNLGTAAIRVEFVPKSSTPYTDHELPEDPGWEDISFRNLLGGNGTTEICVNVPPGGGASSSFI